MTSLRWHDGWPSWKGHEQARTTAAHMLCILGRQGATRDVAGTPRPQRGCGMSYGRDVANGVGAQMMGLAACVAMALIAFGFILGWMAFA